MFPDIGVYPDIGVHPDIGFDRDNTVHPDIGVYPDRFGILGRVSWVRIGVNGLAKSKPNLSNYVGNKAECASNLG